MTPRIVLEMNGKDKMLATMTSGLESDFPVVIPYVDIFLQDHWEEITNQPWWIGQGLDLANRLKVEEDLQGKLDLDWVQCGTCSPKDWRDSHRLEIMGNHIFLKNITSGESREIRKEPIGGTPNPSIKESLIKSLEDVDKHVTVTDEKTLIQKGSLDYAMMIVERFGSKKVICAHVGSGLGLGMSFKETMTNLFRNPELIEYTMEKHLESTIENVKAYAKAGVDAIFIIQCWCSASEVSINHFEHYVLPYTTRLIAEIRRSGMKSIYQPCGDMHDRLDLIVKSGPDCISLEESKKGFDTDISWINEVVAGRACIFGNLDAIWILQDGTSNMLKREIKRQINIGREHGKFVMCLGSPVTPQTPTSRVREYIETSRQESSNICPSN
jgi:uroporphyrinogen-III decarboxylase